MGRDIHVRIVRLDRETNIWKQIKLYRKEKGKFKPVSVYPGRNHELFDILNEQGDDEYFYAPPVMTINLPSALVEEINKYKNIVGYYSFKEINLADLKLYLKKCPQIRNWDYEDNDPKAMKDNPVKFFIEQIECYLNFADPYWEYGAESDIRIIYWFDY